MLVSILLLTLVSGIQNQDIHIHIPKESVPKTGAVEMGQGEVYLQGTLSLIPDYADDEGAKALELGSGGE